MTLNGCSKKLCPLQVGAADNCNLTKEQCHYFTQDMDYYKMLKQIKFEVAKEIFEDIEKLKLTKFDWQDYVDWEGISELKKKYTGEQYGL